jgi:hypothetical protein
VANRAAEGREILSTDFVQTWAGQYDAQYSDRDDGKVERRVKAWLSARFRGGRPYLDKRHFVEIATWKSPRPLRRYESNDDDLVEQVTALAFAARRDDLRLRLLMLLNGVDVRVASTILHFAFPDRYAIMDVRAVTTLTHLGLWTRPVQFSVAGWQVYTHLMRDHAKRLDVTLRELDKALWAFDEARRRGRS